MKRLAPTLFLGFYLLWIFMLFAKAFSVVSWSWWIILAPIWMPFAFGSFIVFLVFLVVIGALGYVIWNPEYK
jgi:hypothetical protein